MRADIEAAKLASERAAALLLQEMGRGRASLAAIASSAPFLGILGTVIGIITSFVGCVGEKSACMAAVTWNLSEAMIPTAASLVVALVATWSHSYLDRQLTLFDTEMRAATLELANALLRQSH